MTDQKMEWNPEEAKNRGTLKGDIEMKINAEHDELKAEFKEPKKKVKQRRSASIIDVSKKNKDALF